MNQREAGEKWAREQEERVLCPTCVWGKRNRRSFDFLTGAVLRRLSIEKTSGKRRVRPSWNQLHQHLAKEHGYPFCRESLCIHVRHVRDGVESVL